MTKELKISVASYPIFNFFLLGYVIRYGNGQGHNGYIQTKRYLTKLEIKLKRIYALQERFEGIKYQRKLPTIHMDGSTPSSLETISNLDIMN